MVQFLDAAYLVYVLFLFADHDRDLFLLHDAAGGKQP